MKPAAIENNIATAPKSIMKITTQRSWENVIDRPMEFQDSQPQRMSE